MRKRLPFIQEFEFVPIVGSFKGRLDELELVFIPNTPNSADLLFQIDRKARGLGGLLSEAFEMDETNVRISITERDLLSLTKELDLLIRKHS